MRAIDLVKRKVVYPHFFYMVITPSSMTEMAKYEIEEKEENTEVKDGKEKQRRKRRRERSKGR